MRKALRSVVVAALVLTGLGVGPLVAEPRRVALILATEGYDALRPLQTPVRDALAMDDLLGELGFEVTLEIDRDLRQLREAVEDFTQDAAGADLALVYYAGHGVEIGGENLILPVDVSADGAEMLKAGALPLNDLATTLRAVVPAVVVIVDACREDPFGSVPDADAEAGRTARGARPLDAKLPDGVEGGFARVGRAEGMIFAFSTAPGKVASDGTGEHSPFAEALIRHLPVPGRSLPDALTLIQQDVYDRSGGWQLPYVETALPDLVFLAGEPPPPGEREQLLLAMAGLTEQDRALVETVAARNGIPLAPLYASWLARNPNWAPEEKEAALERAAVDFVAFRREREGLSPTDPEVATLLAEAFADMELGLLQSARDKLDKAKELGRTTVERSRERLVADIVAAAETYLLSSHLAEVQGDYDTMYDDLLAADDLFASNGGEAMPAEARAIWAKILLQIGRKATYGKSYSESVHMAPAEEALWDAAALYEGLLVDNPGNWLLKAGLVEAHLGLNDLKWSTGFKPVFPPPTISQTGELLKDLAERSGYAQADVAKLAELYHLFASAVWAENNGFDLTVETALQEAIRLQERALEQSPNDLLLSIQLFSWLTELSIGTADSTLSSATELRAMELASALATQPVSPGSEFEIAMIMIAGSRSHYGRFFPVREAELLETIRLTERALTLAPDALSPDHQVALTIDLILWLRELSMLTSDNDISYASSARALELVHEVSKQPIEPSYEEKLVNVLVWAAYQIGGNKAKDYLRRALPLIRKLQDEGGGPDNLSPWIQDVQDELRLLGIEPLQP